MQEWGGNSNCWEAIWAWSIWLLGKLHTFLNFCFSALLNVTFMAMKFVFWVLTMLIFIFSGELSFIKTETIDCFLQSVSLWYDYLSFIQKYDSSVRECSPSGISKARDLFERALTACGLHVTEGCKIWEAYRSYEEMILDGMDKTDSEVWTSFNCSCSSLAHWMLYSFWSFVCFTVEGKAGSKDSKYISSPVVNYSFGLKVNSFDLQDMGV